MAPRTGRPERHQPTLVARRHPHRLSRRGYGAIGSRPTHQHDPRTRCRGPKQRARWLRRRQLLLVVTGRPLPRGLNGSRLRLRRPKRAVPDHGTVDRQRGNRRRAPHLPDARRRKHLRRRLALATCPAPVFMSPERRERETCLGPCRRCYLQRLVRWLVTYLGGVREDVIMQQRLPVVLSVTALAVALLGTTPLGRAAHEL